MINSSDVYAKTSKSVKIVKNIFPDENFRGYVRRCYDKNKDGVLSKKEIKRARKLSIIDEPVSSLKGMKYLINIKEIKINLLGCKDVSSLRNLKKIEVIYLESDKHGGINTRVDLQDLCKSKNIKSLQLYCVDISHSEKVSTFKKLHTFSWTMEKNKKRVLNLKSIKSPLKMKSLCIRNVRIKNETCLKKMKNLENLELYKNGMVKISVNNYKKFRTLSIGGLLMNTMIISNNSLEKVELISCKRMRTITIRDCKDLKDLFIDCDNLDVMNITNASNINDLALSFAKKIPRWEGDVLYKTDNLSVKICAPYDFSKKCPNVTDFSLLITKSMKEINFASDSKIKKLQIMIKNKNCGIDCLDVGSLSEIEDINCGMCGIKKLVLGENKKLRSLFCSDNKLTGTLNFTQTPMLNYFECKHNQLTSLDMHECRQLIIFNCLCNKLKNVNITGSWVREFVCDGNPGINVYYVRKPTDVYSSYDESAVLHEIKDVASNLW